MTPLGKLRSAHALPIIDILTNLAGANWVVTPFVGSSAGITSLSNVLAMRDEGRLEPNECLLAAEQLLNALKVARAAGVPHGALTMDDVIVDRHGSLLIELFGVRRALNGAASNDEAAGSEIWGEVRSVARLVYRLFTGVEVPRAWIDPARFAKRAEKKRVESQVCMWIDLVLRREQPLGVDEALEARSAELSQTAQQAGQWRATRAGRSVLKAALGSKQDSEAPLQA